MTKRVRELLQEVEIMAPESAAGLQVVGLRRVDAVDLDYQTLEEALAAETFEVREVNEGGHVPALKVINQAGRRVFLMAGEHLVGAKQNRALNTSIMVPEATEMEIPVSCVEGNRWTYTSKAFRSSGTLSHHRLRHLMARHVREGYQVQRHPDSRQREVWAEVDHKLARMGSASPTKALAQVYQDYRDRLNEIVAGLRPPEGASGAVFVIGGRIAGLELFDRPATLQRLWPKLVRSYGIDALEVKEASSAGVTAADVAGWIATTAGLKSEIFKSPGEGFDIRLAGEGLEGASLVVEERPVHVLLFAEVDRRPANRGTGQPA